MMGRSGLAGIVLASSLLTACGGGGGVASAPVSTISGNATDGPINGGAVAVYAISHGAKGGILGSTTTDAAGNFALSLGSYSGSVMLQVSGGSYLDEATGAMTTMMNGSVMTAMIPSIVAGEALSGIQVTPVTSMAQAYAQGMAGGMTDANIVAANAALGSYFDIIANGSGDILYTVPINPLVGGSGSGASQSAINYGMVMAAMSQYAHAQGVTDPSEMITAYIGDAVDGILNGRAGGTQMMVGGMGMGGSGTTTMATAAGTSGLASAMSSFLLSPQNQSGVTPAQVQGLISSLSTSNGVL